MAKFEPGDLVKLKSGGPIMTVDEVSVTFKEGERDYICSWLRGATRNCETFTESALKVATEVEESGLQSS